MAAIYAGQFQAELRDLTGRALVAADGASIVVRIAGTNTAATLYNQAGTLAALAALGAAASLGNPLPAANGGGLPGIDGAGNFTFWADPSLEYDLIYTVAGATLPIAPQRVSRLVSDYREPPQAGSVTEPMLAFTVGTQAEVDAETARATAAEATKAAQTSLDTTNTNVTANAASIVAETAARATAVSALTTATGMDALDAVGDGVASDKAVLVAAFAKVRTNARVGLLQLEAKDYKVDDLAVLLPQGANKTLKLQGQGKKASRISFTTDRAGNAIAGDATGGTCFTEIAHLTIHGPGGSITRGTSPATLDGIRAQGGMILNDLSIEGFHAGIVETGDHIAFRQVKSNNNYYGTYRAQGVTGSDVLYDNCDLTSNAMASIGIASGSLNNMTATTFLRGHLGYSPYGVYIEGGDVAYTAKMNGVQFLGTSWEALGIAAIYSADKHALVSFVMDSCRPFSINNALYGISGGATADYMIHVGSISSATIRNTGMSGFGSVPLVAYIDTDYILTPLIWDGWLGDFGVAQTAGTAFIVAPGTAGGVYLRCGAGSGYEGIEAARAYYGGVGVVQRGDLVQIGPVSVVARNTGNKVPIGVALNTPTATYEMCIVAQRGDRVPFNTTASAVGVNDVLVPDGTTKHKVTNIALSAAVATNPIVGQTDAAVASVSGGQITGRVGK